MLDDRKTYKIWIRKANVFDEGTHIEEQIIKTNDIYHEIGCIYCNTLERIDRIDYQELKEKYTIHLTDKQYRYVIDAAQNEIKDKIKEKIEENNRSCLKCRYRGEICNDLCKNKQCVTNEVNKILKAIIKKESAENE